MRDYSDIAMPRSDAVHSREATSFLVTVYMWMWAGLSVTSIVAWMTASSETVRSIVFGSPVVFYGLLIGEVGMVFVLSAAINRLSAGTATFMFLAYSALNGATLSVVLLAYTQQSVLVAFLSAACLFGTMSLYGYITRRDLTSLGSLLKVGLIALIVSLAINMFMRSAAFDYLLSLVGIVLFLGLTAYDTQKVLRYGAQAESHGPAAARKGAILGALALYLDFINLFLYLLRLFGKRK